VDEVPSQLSSRPSCGPLAWPILVFAERAVEADRGITQFLDLACAAHALMHGVVGDRRW
jgi:hypothetical protein